MNKTDLIIKVAKQAELPKKDAELAIDSMFQAISETLAAGEKVNIHGFGIFEVRTRAAREGRNPQTSETIQIPESKFPAFKPGKALKEKVQ